MGVGTRRTPAKEGREGILSQDAAVRAAQTLASMPESEFLRIKGALNRAGAKGVPTASAQTERALILKAIAARDEELTSILDLGRKNLGMPTTTDEILGFANQIRGENSNELIRKSSILDLDGDDKKEALQQRWQTSCAPTLAQMARAESDPIYAFRLHQETIHDTSPSGAIADEQKRMLKEHGGIAVLRGRDGGEGLTRTLPLNSFAGDATDRIYRRRDVADSDEARTVKMNQMEELLKLGVDVPIIVVVEGDATREKGGHALLVSDVRGSSGNREFLVTDPWHGRTGWISEAAIKGGNTDFFGGTGRLARIYDSVSRPPKKGEQ